MNQVIKLLGLFMVLQGTLVGQNDLFLNSAKGLPFQVVYHDSLINSTPSANVAIKNIKKDTVSLLLKTSGRQDTVTVYLLDRKKSTSNKEFLFEVMEENKRLTLRYASMSERSGKELVVAQPPRVETPKKKTPDLQGFAEVKNGHVTFINQVPPVGCQTAMSATHAEQAKTVLSLDNLKDDKVLLVENLVASNCLSIDQLQVFLDVVPFELDRVKIAKKAAPNVVDKENYKALQKNFKFESTFKKVQEIYTGRTPRFSKPDTCKTAIENEKLEGLLTRLKTADNDGERVLLLKEHHGFCYNVGQVRSVLKMFLHDRDRLEAAKLLYPATIDKKDFSSLGQEFTYSQTAEELTNFLNTKPR